MTTATYNQIVEAIGRRKTYSINDNLNVYTTRGEKRGGKRRKVFRVEWETLNYPTPREYSKARHEARRKGRNVWITSYHSVNFEFTEAGYEEALKYVETVKHHNDEIINFYMESYRLHSQAI